MSRKQTPQPFKEITGNGSIDSTGDPLKQEHLDQCFGVSASTQPAATAQLGRHTATAPLRSYGSLCLRATSRSLPPGRGWGLSTTQAPAWVTAPPRDISTSRPGDTGAALGTERPAGLSGLGGGTRCWVRTVTTRGAVSSSNTAWGTACSRDHSTNSFITQHMFSFIKQKKKKETKALFLL